MGAGGVRVDLSVTRARINKRTRARRQRIANRRRQLVLAQAAASAKAAAARARAIEVWTKEERRLRALRRPEEVARENAQRRVTFADTCYITAIPTKFSSPLLKPIASPVQEEKADSNENDDGDTEYDPKNTNGKRRIVPTPVPFVDAQFDSDDEDDDEFTPPVEKLHGETVESPARVAKDSRVAAEMALPNGVLSQEKKRANGKSVASLSSSLESSVPNGKCSDASDDASEKNDEHGVQLPLLSPSSPKTRAWSRAKRRAAALSKCSVASATQSTDTSSPAVAPAVANGVSAPVSPRKNTPKRRRAVENEAVNGICCANGIAKHCTEESDAKRAKKDVTPETERKECLSSEDCERNSAASAPLKGSLQRANGVGACVPDTQHSTPLADAAKGNKSGECAKDVKSAKNASSKDAVANGVTANGICESKATEKEATETVENIDSLFASLSKHKAAAREAAAAVVIQAKGKAKSSSPSPSPSPSPRQRIRDKRKLIASANAAGSGANGVKYTQDGLRIYSYDEIAADQPKGLNGPCPFDCSCCF